MILAIVLVVLIFVLVILVILISVLIVLVILISVLVFHMIHPPLFNTALPRYYYAHHFRIYPLP